MYFCYNYSPDDLDTQRRFNMASFQQKLIDLLLTDERLKSQDGQLLKNQAHELARKNDPNLIKLLFSDKIIKEHFFIEVEGTMIFDKDKFIRFISSKQFLPNSYTAFRNKIGLVVNEGFIHENKDTVLSWPYKDSVLVGGMDKEDKRRNELFYNETLAADEINYLLDAKAFRNISRHTGASEESVQSFKRAQNGLIRENLIIKGNNLLALHSLVKQFSGRVKLIYIDPPFNTRSDSFRYNDSFNHSTWLTFMKNRLEIARELLSPDGSIYVHLDFNEVHYCKVLMDELFGEENFQREIIWRMGWVSGYKTMAKNWIRNHDTLLFYTKNPDNFTFNKKWLPYPKDYERWGGREKGQGLAIEDVWGINVGEGLNSLAVISFAREYTGFRTQKPESLLQRLIEVSSNEGDIVMDFFMGTGTTPVVAHKLNRQYIGIEQLDYGEIDSVKRIEAVINGDQSGISQDVKWIGGGEFVYMELAKWNQAWIDRIQAAISSEDLLRIWEEMNEKAFLSYKVNPKTINENASDFLELSFSDQKRFLIECMDKNHLYVNYSEIDDADYGLTEEEIRLNKDFYQNK